MVEKSSKSIENKCTHSAIRLVLNGKDAHRKGNSKHVRSWSKSQVISAVFFASKIQKSQRISVPTLQWL